MKKPANAGFPYQGIEILVDVPLRRSSCDVDLNQRIPEGSVLPAACVRIANA